MFESQNSNKFNNLKVRLTNKADIEPQEIFLDRITLNRVEEMGSSEQKIEVPLSRRTFYGLLFSVFALMSILFLRSFQLQIIHGGEYARLAERNKYDFLSIQASRGVIYDSNFNQIVFNDFHFILIFDKREVPEDIMDERIREIATVFNLDYKATKELIKSSESDEVIIMRDIDHERLVLLEVRSHDFPGIRVEKKLSRNYPDPEIFSHLVGYMGKISPEKLSLSDGRYSIKDYVGKSGLEKYYEDVLRVIPGRIRIERNAVGKIQSEEVVSLAESGKSLVLWLDADLQKKIHQEIGNVLDNIGSKNAAVVAIDPRTGGILAMVSYPGFDNNLFSGKRDPKGIQRLFKDPRNPLFNRVIAGTYSVGSTIKPIIGLAALQEGIVTAANRFYSAGYLTIPNPWNPSNPARFADNNAHGWVDVKRAIAVSSNVYFYIVGGGHENQPGLGSKLIKKYLNLFGWGSKTNVDLPGEKEGFVPTPEWKIDTIGEPWRMGDNYNLSIGQGYLSVTPLQVATAFVPIANKGNLLRPMVVKSIVDENRNIIENKETEIVRDNFLNPIHLNTIREGMRDTVIYGSGRSLNSLPVKAAAKTGTAQIPKAGHYHNWVTVFAPYDDPEIVLVIVIEEVRGIRVATLPVAKEILQWYFSR